MQAPLANGESRLRVLLVDHDERVRESLAGLLAIGDRLHVVGLAGEPGRAIELARDTQPDVVVVDPRLPEIDRGRAFIVEARRAAPEARVVVLSWSEGLDESYLTCDADRIVRKTFRPSELVEAIVTTCAPNAP